MSALSQFHPLITRWFTEQIGTPTEVQEQSWQKIASGEHLLITAPTGSGKTLAAFLWAINQLVTGQFPTGHTSILYISPLKALNNDIQRNLLGPLSELEKSFTEAGAGFPNISVRTRSGDTPPSDRLQMQRHPPEILITTPESLNLLLSSAGGRSILRGISTVILDEVHAVVGTKRGTYLTTAVERLVPMSGEFQRIALSATIRPVETVAEFVGGFQIEGTPPNPRHTARSVSIVRSDMTKQYDIHVRFPEEPDYRIQESIWDPLADEFRKTIAHNRSTLLFANSRRLCEKLAQKINSGEETALAYVHHGSLSREIRTEVERRLREGELRAVVATNSLELGIDIGALDEVIMVQSPNSVSSAIQRVGRAGHQVGEVSRGTIFPTHSQDLLEAAVLAPAILNHDMEAIEPIRCPLDVLAQVIVSMVGIETWDINELYMHLTASYPYRHLSREQFDLVLNMLGGRYADSRVRELRPYVSIDRLDNTVAARKGALLTVYTSGGVIPDRGYFHLRHSENNALIGELDEEFVWEASIGQTFTLGTQSWRIERITHNDVFVMPGSPKVMATPFWRGEENYRDFHFSERLGQFLETANNHLDNADFTISLQKSNCMDPAAAAQLVDFLKRQKEETACELPHRHHIVAEFISTGPGGVPGNQLILHTVWGGRVNRPFAMVLDAAWEEHFGHRLEMYASNDHIVLQLPHEVSGDEVLSLVSSVNVEQLLRKRLEGSGFFGARFRECAGRSLLITRNRLSERMPLWMSRLRSQKLLEAVLQYDDFPILLETWRTCLLDEFDLKSLQQVLAELESGAIQWSEAHTSHPSPMAQSISWKQTNEYMYMGDEPTAGTTSKLRGDLLEHVVFTPGLRPQIAPDIIGQFELKRQRLAPGYSPEAPRDLVDWVKERLLIPASEWERLLQAIHNDHGVEIDSLLESVSDRLVRIVPSEASESMIVALETKSRVIYGLYGTEQVPTEPLLPSMTVPRSSLEAPDDDRDEVLTSVLGEWLQFYGPASFEFIRTTLGIENQRLSLALEDLIDSQKVIMGQLITGATDDEVCDSENFEVLLRLMRAGAVPVFEPVDAEWLPLFLAHYQGVTQPEDSVEGLFHCIEQLLCLPVPAEMWETEFLPARLHPYSTSWLDTIMQEGDLRWVGNGNRRVAFCFESDLDLMQVDNGAPDSDAQPDDETIFEELFPHAIGRYDFATLMDISKYRSDRLSDRLWKEVWQGKVTNDTFAALRKGIENRYKVPKTTTTKTGPHIRGRRRVASRASFSRWKGSIPFAGNWFQLPTPESTEDIIEAEERKKDRARLLLDRYGILFRELLERESPPFRWSSIFRALRLMELSGEVLAGYFFHGIPGPQFISHQAFHILQRKLPEDAVYWVNATDPASLCGVQLEATKRPLPKRIAGTHLVYQSNRLVIISRRNGRALTFNVPPDDPRLPEYLGFLQHLLIRQFQPVRRITIETINGEDAAYSEYLDIIRTCFDVMVDYKHVVLYRKVSS
ncbi:MAG TPA: DEAD/DEAH box helicase [Dehalococcoidia bacterium]|nr:DEAD/DEAH box helicase [Dehalococcoidia bacterium]